MILTCIIDEGHRKSCKATASVLGKQAALSDDKVNKTPEMQSTWQSKEHLGSKSIYGAEESRQI